MQLVGTRGQQVRDYLYDASGAIAAGATPQLVLPEHISRSYLFLQNLSIHNMWVEIGAGTATATLTNGVVTSVSVVNGGFGFTIAPQVTFYGGGGISNGLYKGAGALGYPAPSAPAYGLATLSGGVVNAINVSFGGVSYVTAPLVFLNNSPNDPNGCADPSLNGGSGFLLAANGPPVIFQNTVCPTSPVAIYSANTGDRFVCKYMP